MLKFLIMTGICFTTTILIFAGVFFVLTVGIKTGELIGKISDTYGIVGSVLAYTVVILILSMISAGIICCTN